MAELVFESRNNQLAIDRGQERHRGHGQDHRPQHAPLGNAGRLQGRELVVPLNPGDGKHGADQRENAARLIEEPERSRGVVFAKDPKQIAVLPLGSDAVESDMGAGEGDELLEVVERVDHDIQSGQTAKEDHERLDELSEQIAVDKQHGLVRLIYAEEEAAWARIAVASAATPRAIFSADCTPKLRRMV